MTASAVVLRAGDARVVIEPDHGARLTSIVLAGREWLQQPVVELRAAQPFDAFVRPDIAGWDEMVPTCVAVEHGGVALPDHGEVWSRPWDVVSVDGHELTTRIRCATVALTVERRATLTDGELALRYVLENVGDRPAAAFWMAHPLFDATDLVAVEVHPGDAAVVSTVDSRNPARRVTEPPARCWRATSNRVGTASTDSATSASSRGSRSCAPTGRASRSGGAPTCRCTCSGGSTTPGSDRRRWSPPSPPRRPATIPSPPRRAGASRCWRRVPDSRWRSRSPRRLAP